MLVAQTGHIALLGCERWVASTSAAERRHNEIWVREFLDDPVTPATVEMLMLAAAS